MSPALPILLGSLFAAACLLGAFLALRRKRVIDDLPTSKTQGVFIGLAELKGKAESESPFSAYLSGVRCVQYNWKIEEHWSKTVTETYTDNKGHLQTRTRTESGWKQVASGGQSAPFYLKDDTGAIRINPEGAKTQAKTVFNETYRPRDPMYFGKTSAPEIAHSTHQRRFHENALPLHIDLYVLGQARERQDVVAAEIAKEKNSMFIISIRSEKQISSGYGIWYWILLLVGLLCALGGGIGWSFLSNLNGLSWNQPLIMTAGYVILLAIVYVWTTYNNLINLHHRVEQGWSQVDIQLKRRYDLIPNIVEIVAGFKQYENDTQTTLANLRGQLKNDPLPGNVKAISASLRISIESYPELKANSGFMKLQGALVDTEQRIALARDYYNDIATFYSNRLEMVPERYVARIARLSKPELVSAVDFERATVEVNLTE